MRFFKLLLGASLALFLSITMTGCTHEEDGHSHSHSSLQHVTTIAKA